MPTAPGSGGPAEICTPRPGPAPPPGFCGQGGTHHRPWVPREVGFGTHGGHSPTCTRPCVQLLFPSLCTRPSQATPLPTADEPGDGTRKWYTATSTKLPSVRAARGQPRAKEGTWVPCSGERPSVSCLTHSHTRAHTHAHRTELLGEGAGVRQGMLRHRELGPLLPGRRWQGPSVGKGPDPCSPTLCWAEAPILGEQPPS